MQPRRPAAVGLAAAPDPTQQRCPCSRGAQKLLDWLPPLSPLRNPLLRRRRRAPAAGRIASGGAGPPCRSAGAVSVASVCVTLVCFNVPGPQLGANSPGSGAVARRPLSRARRHSWFRLSLSPSLPPLAPSPLTSLHRPPCQCHVASAANWWRRTMSSGRQSIAWTRTRLLCCGRATCGSMSFGLPIAQCVGP